MNEEEAVEKVLRRAEISRITRHLKSRLALASFKTKRGWESLTLDSIEPRINEELSHHQGPPEDIQSSPLRRNMYSNFSSPPGPGSDLQTMEFLEPPVEFTRKRAKTLPSNAIINVTFDGVDENKENKRGIEAAETNDGHAAHAAHVANATNATNINAHTQNNGSNMGNMGNMGSDSTHLEPPKTPPRRQTDKDGASLLMYLATSPSPAQRSTFAPPNNHGKPVNMPGSSPFPKTPQQTFNFNDYLNIMTPSPAGSHHHSQLTRATQTPRSGPRRRLFED